MASPDISPRAILAEDEEVLRHQLRVQLTALWPELRIVAEVTDGIAAMRALESDPPDILFLDIQMPGLSGLEVAHQASGRCHVVFVTAYDKYAIAAFEQGAVDYVMKPFTAGRLATTIGRLKQRLGSTPANLEGLLRQLAQTLNREQTYLRWIPRRRDRTCGSLPSRKSATSMRRASTRRCHCGFPGVNPPADQGARRRAGSEPVLADPPRHIGQRQLHRRRQPRFSRPLARAVENAQGNVAGQRSVHAFFKQM